MYHQLYSFVSTDDEEKKDLYIRNTVTKKNQKVILKKGEILDFFTYFNAFSLTKWKTYTSIRSIRIELNLEGSFTVTCKGASKTGETNIFEETVTGHYTHTISPDEVDADILGLSITALEDGAAYAGGAYYGAFDSWQEQQIGIGICTFKREEYVLRTIDVLQKFQKNNDWLHVLVVDNGGTLEEKTGNRFAIIHNRNFGGSGGFTRAMIEYMDADTVDYVLLMDDDIVLEPSALERTHSLLCGLKDAYKESYLSGAMLTLDQPTIQFENTAYWAKIHPHSIGQKVDLSVPQSLVLNEQPHHEKNLYGGWWYCCMPVARMKQNGLPLPVFIKGDDIEYGIRNKRTWLTLNGVGVWHQAFVNKGSKVIDYYSDRNMLMINNFAEDCGMLTFTAGVFGRIAKRMLQFRLDALHMLNLALIDYMSGLGAITSKGSDEKMADVVAYSKQSITVVVFINLLINALKAVCSYGKVHREYIAFRKAHLADDTFWKQFLKLGENHE